MPAAVFAGIWCLGFVFGYLLYYSVRHTKDVGIDLLSSVAGTLGGAAVTGLFGKIEGWLAPYGIGVGCGFLFYLILALIFIWKGKFGPVADNKVMILSRTLLGAPRQE